MYGLIITIIGIAMFCIIALVDAFGPNEPNLLGKLRTKIKHSANFNIGIYLLPLPFILIGTFVFVYNNPTPILLHIFPIVDTQIKLGVGLTLSVIIANLVRFERCGVGQKQADSIYKIAEQLIESNEDYKSGFIESVVYIKGCTRNYRFVKLSDYLTFLSRRDDEIGMIARERMKERDIDTPE